MKVSNVIPLGLSLCLCACSSVEQRGTVTIQGRGTQQLTDRGDPLMGTGIYGPRKVPKEFAMGYAKGISDQVQREYWQLQDEVSSRRAPGTGRPEVDPAPTPQGSSLPGSGEGAPHYYQITLPESVDPDTGVRHAPRDLTVPINE
jgi:hypothetical protein